VLKSTYGTVPPKVDPLTVYVTWTLPLTVSVRFSVIVEAV